MVKVGDSIPSIPLKEGKPDAEVDLSKELGNGIIIGVPAAFSMSLAIF
jgi:2-Cys peroxiredoxin 5